MNKILFLVLAATLACNAAEEEYSKFSSNKNGKLVVQIDNENQYKRQEERRKVLVKLSAANKPDDYDQEKPSLKSRYDEERYQEDKYVYDYKDQQDTDDKQYTYKQEVDEKIEKVPQPVYVNVNVNKDGQIYKPEPKKIRVNVKFDNDKQDEYVNQDQQYVSKILTSYDEKPKKLLINLKLHKDRNEYSEQSAYGPKKVNINVRISKVQEPKYEEKEMKRDTVLDRLYKISKKYTNL